MQEWGEWGTQAWHITTLSWCPVTDDLSHINIRNLSLTPATLTQTGDITSALITHVSIIKFDPDDVGQTRTKIEEGWRRELGEAGVWRGQDDIKTKRDGWWWWPLVINTDRSSHQKRAGRELLLALKQTTHPSILSSLTSLTPSIFHFNCCIVDWVSQFSVSFFSFRSFAVMWVRFVDVITGWLSQWLSSDCCVGFGCQDNYVINTDSELANYRLVWPQLRTIHLPVWQMISY